MVGLCRGVRCELIRTINPVLRISFHVACREIFNFSKSQSVTKRVIARYQELFLIEKPFFQDIMHLYKGEMLPYGVF